MLGIERKLQEFRTSLSVKRQEIGKIDPYYVVGTVGVAVPMAIILGIAVDVDARGKAFEEIERKAFLSTRGYEISIATSDSYSVRISDIAYRLHGVDSRSILNEALRSISRDNPDCNIRRVEKEDVRGRFRVVLNCM